MISYNRRCQEGHVFEAWCNDSATYDAQAAAGEVVCPMCGDRTIVKAPMAPRIAKSRGGDADARMRAVATKMQDRLTEIRRPIEGHFDYVGERFAAEARRIQRGETEPRDLSCGAPGAEPKNPKNQGAAITTTP